MKHMSGHSLTIKNYKKLIFATVPFISTKLSIFLYFGTYFSKSHTSDVRRGNMTVGFVEISKTCKRARAAIMSDDRTTIDDRLDPPD